MNDSRSRSALQALASSQLEFRDFLQRAARLLGLDHADGPPSPKRAEAVLEGIGRAAGGERAAREELGVVGFLLERAYVNSTDIEDAQFFSKELAMRVNARVRELGTEGWSGRREAEWRRLEAGWQEAKGCRQASVASGKGEEEAVGLMERLLAERDGAARDAMRGRAQAEAELEFEREALRERGRLLAAALEVQASQELRIAELVAKARAAELARQSVLDEAASRAEAELSALRAELAERGEEACRLRRQLTEKSSEAEAAAQLGAMKKEVEEERDLLRAKMREELAAERGDFKLVFARLEARNEEIKQLLPFREKCGYLKEEIARLTRENESVKEEFLAFHAELRKLRDKAKGLAETNEELAEAKKRAEARAWAAERRGALGARQRALATQPDDDRLSEFVTARHKSLKEMVSTPGSRRAQTKILPVDSGRNFSAFNRF